MKRSTIFLLAIIVPSLVLAQRGSYIIKGKVAKPSGPAMAYFYSSTTKDSTLLDNGEFVFKGTVDQPASAVLIIYKAGANITDKDSGYIEFYLEPGTISLTAPDSLNNAKITGGQVNADNERLKRLLVPVTRKIMAAYREFNSASAERKKSKNYIEDFDKKIDTLLNEQRAVYLTFITANPNSMLSLLILKNNISPAADVEPVFNLLAKNLKKSKMGLECAAKIANMEKTEVGAIAPDFTQVDTSGKLISLHDFKGRYVLVDFWASWCGACREENPNIVKVFDQYKAKGFTVLGVSLDGLAGKGAWLKAIHDDHLTWTQVSDRNSWKNKAAILYNVRGIPQNFLIGPDGKIVAKSLRVDDLCNKLKELLDK